MIFRTAFALGCAAMGSAMAALPISQNDAMAIARSAVPGGRPVSVALTTECNNAYWYVNVQRGADKYLVLTSATGKVLRVVSTD